MCTLGTLRCLEYLLPIEKLNASSVNNINNNLHCYVKLLPQQNI